MNAPSNVGIYNLSYGAVYDCPVDDGTCAGFPNEDLYDTRGETYAYKHICIIQINELVVIIIYM